MRVPSTLQIPADVDMRTGRPASALRVGHAAAAGVTHVIGHMLGGARILQCGDGYELEHTGTYRWLVWRHPNCDHLYVEAEVVGLVTPQGGTLIVTAGTGDAQTWTAYGETSSEEYISMRVPWHADDVGWCEVTAAVSGVYVRLFGAYDWPRVDIATTDHAVQIDDASHPRIGLREGMPIAQATNGSIAGVLRVLQQCWDDYRGVAATWAALAGVHTSSASEFNPWGDGDDFYWSHQARQRVASDQSRPYRAGVYAKCDAGVTYTLTLASHNTGAAADDSVALTGLTNSTAAWQILSTVDTDCLNTAQMTVTAQRTAGSGNISIYGVSIGES